MNTRGLIPRSLLQTACVAAAMFALLWQLAPKAMAQKL